MKLAVAFKLRLVPSSVLSAPPSLSAEWFMKLVYPLKSNTVLYDDNITVYWESNRAFLGGAI